MKVKIKKKHTDAVTPEYKTEGAACLDLVAVDASFTPGMPYVEYDTGIALEIPEGYVGLIYPRSSVSDRGLTLCNSTGIIDSDYRGSIKFRFYNMNEWCDFYDIGDRIGQIMIVPYPRIEFEESYELGDTERGTGGYGSTGQ